MKRIRTMQDVERIQRRNNMIMGIVMIGLLVFSYAGFSLMSAGEDGGSGVNELGFDFVRDGGLWKTSISGQTFGFQYLPSEVASVDVNVTRELGMYSGRTLYFVSPNEGASEILNNVGSYILRYQEACLESVGNESICDGDFPVKNCGDNLIVFRSGNETKVYENESCVYLVGDGVRASDAFLYEVLDIR